MAEHKGEPRVLKEALEVLKETNFGEKPNPVAPFMREILLPAILHTPAVLRAAVTSRAFIGATLGGATGYFFGQPGVGFIVGTVSGELLLKPEVIHKARIIARRVFNSLMS